MMDNNQSKYKQDIAADDRRGQPDRDSFQIMSVLQAQQHHPGYEQNFVRERIQDPSQFAMLIVAPGQVPIHTVTDCGHCESQQRNQSINLVATVGVIKHCHDEQRHQQNPGNGDFVGRRHLQELFGESGLTSNPDYSGPRWFDGVKLKCRMRARSRLNSGRKSGCAIEINASPRSRKVFPCRFTAPYSVTTQCTCPRVLTTPAPQFNSVTMRDTFPFAAVDGNASTGFPPRESAAPRTKSICPPIPE